MNQEQILMAVFSGVVAAIAMAVYLVSRSVVNKRKLDLKERLEPVDTTTLESALPLPPAKDWSERLDRRFANLVLGSGLDASVEQIVGIAQPRVDRRDAADHVLQRLALAAQVLGALGFVPDVRRLQQAGDFGQAGFLGIVVKDTPEVRPAVAAGQRCG